MEATSLRSVLRDRFSIDFRGLVQKYADTYPENLDQPSKGKVFYQVKDVHLRKTYTPMFQPISDTQVLYFVEGNLKQVIFEPAKPASSFQERMLTYLFRIQGSLDLRPCVSGVGDVYMKVVDKLPEENSEREVEDIQMDDYLLPILYEDDYDKVAEEILKTYYPEGHPVDGRKLAERMGLSIVEGGLVDHEDTYGLICFDFSEVKVLCKDGVVRRLRLNPGNIFLNTNKLKNQRMCNSTIIHECVHMYLDRHYFFLQRMSGLKATAYAARKERNYSWRNTPVDWMELQADKMPAHILMEKHAALAAIERLFSEYQGSRDPQTVRAVIFALADEFEVSPSMAKYRMVELGYPEAEGVFNYPDHLPVPDHGCAGIWRKGITYTVPEKDIAAILKTTALGDPVRRMKYRFVENHFCLNSSKYIWKDGRGKLRLTAYARNHIDECCIAFSTRGRYSGAEYDARMAARGKMERPADKYLCHYQIDAEPGTTEYEEQIEFYLDDQDRWNNLIDNLPHDFTLAFTKARKELQTSEETLGFRIGRSQKKVSKIITSKDPKLREVIALCIAMQIPKKLSDKLIKLAGKSYEADPMASYFESWLDMCGDFTVEHCNAVLVKLGQEPLIDGEFD